MRHEIVDVIFLLLGAAITAGSILFYRWLDKEYKKIEPKIEAVITEVKQDIKEVK